MSRHRMHTDDVDTVDLTLSSPEPQPAPQPQSYSQSQSRHHRKQHASPFGGTRNPSPRRAVAGPSNHLSRQVPANTTSPRPTISQEHLRNIINTAPGRELKDLLLHLCASSPALSGAVVRGLAPHSIWAQETIRDYNRRNERAKLKSEHGVSPSTDWPRPLARSQSSRQPITPRPKSSNQCEVDILDTESDETLSDLELLFGKPVRSSDQKGKKPAVPSSSAHVVLNEATSTINRASQNSADHPLSVRVKSESRTNALICITCNQTIRPGSRCRFHVGRKKIEKRGSEKIQTWSCCGRALSDVGCCEEDHIPLRNYDLEDVSPSNISKKPRLI